MGLNFVVVYLCNFKERSFFFNILFYKDNYHKSINEWVDKFFEKISSAQFDSFSPRYDNEDYSNVHFLISSLVQPFFSTKKKNKIKSQNLQSYLVTIFIFCFQKLVCGNKNKKWFSFIFKVRNMFGKLWKKNIFSRT